jgi:hypothetical protein
LKKHERTVRPFGGESFIEVAESMLGWNFEKEKARSKDKNGNQVLCPSNYLSIILLNHIQYQKNNTPNVTKAAAINRKKSLIGSSSYLLFNHQVITKTSTIIPIYIVAGVIKYFIVIMFSRVLWSDTNTILGR